MILGQSNLDGPWINLPRGLLDRDTLRRAVVGKEDEMKAQAKSERFHSISPPNLSTPS
jgi:hypothetical protein